MMPAHKDYTDRTGVEIAYTGARAGSLGKSLLEGNGHTDVFCGRQLNLAQNLRKKGKMEYFRPLCFTSYAIVVPPEILSASNPLKTWQSPAYLSP